MSARLCTKEFDGLLKSELEKAIDETVLSKEDSLVAKMYLLERRTHAEIACEIYRDRSTVTRRLPAILERISKTVKRLDFRNIFTTLHQTPTRIHPLWGFFCYH